MVIHLHALHPHMEPFVQYQNAPFKPTPRKKTRKVHELNDQILFFGHCARVCMCELHCSRAENKSVCPHLL